MLTVRGSLQGTGVCKVSCTGVSGAEVATFDIEVHASIEALRGMISECSGLMEFCLVLPNAATLNDPTTEIFDLL